MTHPDIMAAEEELTIQIGGLNLVHVRYVQLTICSYNYNCNTK